MGWHGSLPPSGACLFPCVVDLSYMVYFNFLGCVLVPLVVMFIIYGHIFLTVRQQLRRIAAGRGPARSDTRDGESGPARSDTRDGESGPARSDTRDGESGPARSGESGPARADTREEESGPARSDTRDGESGPARADTRDCGSGAGSREDEAGAGKRTRVEFGSGKRTRVEAGAGKRTRVEAGAGKRTRVEAGAGKRTRVEAWGVSGVAVWGRAGNKWPEGESWSGNAGEMTSHASGCVRTDSGSVVASESKSESRGPVKARCGSGGSEYKRAVRMRREVRKATSLFLVLFLFMLCWLPLHFLNCVTLMCPRCHVPLPLTLAAILLSHANSALNPLLYAYRMRSFRHTLRALCCTHTA
eukprot:XP_014067053.1 PREDICTED: alpha-2C adrenergic receptor-like [Salmo salar]